MPPILVVHIVTFNSSRYIRQCLESILSQEKLVLKKDYQILITDNASSDSTLSVIEKLFSEKVGITRCARNLGFCRAHNDGLKRAFDIGARYVFVCNPDVVLAPNALRTLVQALDLDAASGMAFPKIMRTDENLEPVSPPRFDSTGIYIRPDLRHFDRASDEPDLGNYAGDEYVFGASGAAVMVRKEFALDVALSSDISSVELFDNNFFAYREDADLSWRAQWLAWKCRYVSSAVAYHVRKVLPENRAKLPARINALGVQNRFLLQINNFAFLANVRCLLPAIWRNILVILASFSVEFRSASGILSALRQSKSALRHRKLIKAKRRVSALSLRKWFSYSPAAEVALSIVPRAVTSLRIIIVNYNSRERLERCLSALTPGLGSLDILDKIEVVIADNCSYDESLFSAQNIIARHDFISVKHLGSNLGFAGAVNAAAENAGCDALLILNPDIEITARNVELLAETMSFHSNLALLSPILRSQDGTAQLGFVARRFPNVAATIAEFFFIHRLWPDNPWTKYYALRDDALLTDALKGERQDSRFQAPLCVPQPAGACMMIRKEAFDALGGFDTDFWPAWFEDVDFCKRLATGNWLSAILPGSTAIHEGGYSYKQLSSLVFAKIWYANLLRYWRKHGSSRQYYVVRTAHFLAMPVRAVVACIRAVITFPKNRAQAASLINFARGLVSIAFSPFAVHKEYQRNRTAVLKERSAACVRDLRLAYRKFFGKSTEVDGVDIPFNRSPLPIQGAEFNFNRVIEEDIDWRSQFASNCSGKGKQIAQANFPVIEAISGPWILGDQFIEVDALKGVSSKESLEVLEQIRSDSVPLGVSCKNDKYDFLILSHVFEYVPDPISSLRQWLSLLRTNGYCYLIVSDKRFSADAVRARTPLEHILLDHLEPSADRDLEHYLEYSASILGKGGFEALRHAQTLAANESPIRFHTFTPDDVLALLGWFSKNVAQLKMEHHPAQTPASDECHFVFRLKQEYFVEAKQQNRATA